MYPRRADPRAYLVAESPAMRAVVAAIESHAASDGPVLITGERGTGRELVARVLHLTSRRRQGKFVAVRPTFDGGEPTDDDEVRTKRA
ncbi:MAG TPA: sigma 54-interacting transcriptional regulator, partial [Kofleriaceae bacterium]|nr:sigma 54-interacting transcriptional regulator [Kofleriaceae bacterium]